MSLSLYSPVIYRSFRVRTGQSIGATINGTAWTITAGTYADLPELMAEMDARLTAAAGTAFTVEMLDGDRGATGVRIRRDDGVAFTLTAVHAALQSALGLAATYAPGVVADSAATPTIVYVPAYPISDSDCWYEYVRAETIHPLGASVTTLRATITHWTGRVLDDDIARWRVFGAFLRRGVPFRLFHDYPADTSAWSLANLDGYLDLVMARPEQVEAWLSDPATVVLDGTLDCLVV